MALVGDDASEYLSQLPPEQQKYRYPMNGLPEIRTDITPEDKSVTDTCLDALRKLK